MIVKLSIIIRPSAVTNVGERPRGCMDANSLGARLSFAPREYRTTLYSSLYSIESSSRSHRMRWDWEFWDVLARFLGHKADKH